MCDEAAHEHPEPEDDPARDGAADDERARYLEELRERGEAAQADEHGILPPGATHEIIERGPGKQPEVKRRRFSLS
jgi:hypothetical protein